METNIYNGYYALLYQQVLDMIKKLKPAEKLFMEKYQHYVIKRTLIFKKINILNSVSQAVFQDGFLI